jgi:hypothetical protein
MKNSISLCFLFVLIFQGKAQSVIGTTGGEGTVGTMNIYYTVGETAMTTISNDSTTLSQGFHQPYLFTTAIEETFLPGEVTVFPNPTASILNVQFDGIELRNLSVSLHDFAGRSISYSAVTNANWQIDLSDLSGGIYLLTVTDIENNKLNSFKIFKSN